MSNLMISIPFSDEEKLAELEGTILADRMRHCWKLWNKGHPFVEIVDYKCTDDNFEIVISTEEQTGGRNKWWDEKIEELVPFILARFIQELSILHRDEVPDGHYQCHLQHHPSLRIVLVPAAPIYRNKLVSIHSRSSSTADDAGAILTDIRRLISLAQKALYPFGQATGLRLSGQKPLKLLSQAAEWIGESFDPICIPIDQKTFEDNDFTNPFFSSGRSDSNAIWECCLFDSDSTQIKLGTGISRIGKTRLYKDKSTFEVRDDAPIFRCTLVPLPDNLGGAPTLALRRMWTDCINGWNHNYSNRALFNIQATLRAEKMQLLRECYPVSLIPSNDAKISPELVAFKLHIDEPHPVFGNVTRIDGASLIDQALEDGIFEVIINDNPNPLHTKGKRFEIIHSKENDPNILILKPSEISTSKPVEKGWMRLDNPGTRVLHQRKNRFIRGALSTKVIQRILIDSEDIMNHRDLWRSRHENWRLVDGSLQIIQGPPGTGKTWTATRLVEDILRERPQARILLCAKEHLALDHLATSVSEALKSDEFKGFQVLRLMSSTRRESLQDSQLNPNLIGEKSVNDLLEIARKFSKKKGYKSRLIEIEGSMKTKDLRASWPASFAENEANIVAVSVTDQMMVDYLDNMVAFDYVILEEAGKSYPSELLAPISLGRTSILIGDQMQLPPFEIREIRDNISKFLSLRNFEGDRNEWKDIQLSNLIRESKYAYYDQEIEEIVSQIEPLLEPFKLFYGQYPSMMLEEERRMFKELSDIVGEVFYGAPFKWMKENTISPSELPEIFKNYGRIIVGDIPHCSKVEACREKRSKGRSLCNEKEAEIAAHLAEKIHHEGGEVVILSPYQGQVDLISEKLSTEIPVFTVDGYQGKEADYILLSLVRNNEKTAARRWGFVSDPNRLNVALSRAREGLIVLTSLEHLRGSEFREGNDHLNQAIELLSKNGTLVTANDLGGWN